MEILAQLGVDGTIWTQFVIFISLFIILRYLYFLPFLRLIEARKLKTEGLEKQAAELNRKAAEAELEYSQKLDEVKKRARDEKEKRILEAKLQAQKILHEARDQHKKIIVEARVRQAAETEKMFTELRQSVRSLAELFVKKLTEKKVGL